MPEPFREPLNAQTRFCAVFGHPVRHSASPAMQNAGLASLGLNWRYLALEVHLDDLRAALDGAQAMRFIGVNLTVPHKLRAMDMVNLLDESAKTSGAVNTVMFEGRGLGEDWQPLRSFDEWPREVRSHGFNTDADAISRALSEDLGAKLFGATVLILGAGGAGRTATLKLASEGVKELFLVNRTRSRAERLAEEITILYPTLKVRVGYPPGKVDLLVNATSLGLSSADPLPLDQQQFPISRAAAVYDMIYRPPETPLLQLARAAGCRASNGVGMLLYQGAKALEIWTGQAAPLEVMRHALEKNVYG